MCEDDCADKSKSAMDVVSGKKDMSSAGQDWQDVSILQKD